MKKLAIIYICTGAYIEFWENFFDSFEKNFLSGYEKHYYVFSDTSEIYQKDNPRVHYNYQMHLPWPLIALLKFYISLRVATELETYDFVYISNANIVCADNISEEEFLPKKESGERYVFTAHPGYFYDRRYNKKYYTEYERNNTSKAYIPYNIGRTYVYGNMWGGSGKDYVQLASWLDRRIKEDLKKRIIAIWHDESYVNHYVVQNDDFRILHPGYCYPVGFDVDFEKKIVGVPKATIFDVNMFKGYYSEEGMQKKCIAVRILNRTKNWIISRFLPWVYYIRDLVLKRKPAK